MYSLQEDTGEWRIIENTRSYSVPCSTVQTYSLQRSHELVSLFVVFLWINNQLTDTLDREGRTIVCVCACVCVSSELSLQVLYGISMVNCCVRTLHMCEELIQHKIQ